MQCDTVIQLFWIIALFLPSSTSRLSCNHGRLVELKFNFPMYSNLIIFFSFDKPFFCRCYILGLLEKALNNMWYEIYDIITFVAASQLTIKLIKRRLEEEKQKCHSLPRLIENCKSRPFSLATAADKVLWF